MKKIVLIIGNGFDLDLGLKTSYMDFADSEFWPKGILIEKENIYRKQGLLAFLDKYKSDNWFDLESLLKKFADSNYSYVEMTYNRSSRVEENKQLFYGIIQNLSFYLNKQQECASLNHPSLASQFISKCNYFNKIYTFNYTDINYLAERLGYGTSCNVIHLHGSIKENNIILGVDESDVLIDSYRFLQKSFNSNYKSHHLLADLDKANEVIFFGFSFSTIDLGYFNNWLSNCKRKTIKIITKDRESLEAIKANLQNKGLKISGLYGQSFVEHFYTDDQPCFDDIIRAKWHEKILFRLRSLF